MFIYMYVFIYMKALLKIHQQHENEIILSLDVHVFLFV